MKEKVFDQEHRCHIAAMALGLVDAIESNIIDTKTAQKLLFRPGIFEKYKEDPELYRLLNLGEELDTIVRTLPEFKERSIGEIKELCNKILSEGKRRNSMGNYRFILKHLEAKGYFVAAGMTEEERKKVEEIYGFKFPQALADFYSCGVPCLSSAISFPLWKDFNENNVRAIKKMIEDPINWLKEDVKNGFWLKSWGKRPENEEEALEVFSRVASKAPKLIPIYSHRYVPVIEGVDDPPVISTVGMDTIIYGGNLSEYLQNEFFGGKLSTVPAVSIPFWSEIIENAEKPMNKNIVINNNEDVIAFYKATNSLHDGVVAFAEEFGDCLRVGVDVASIIGSPRVEMIFRGVKSWRIKCGDEIFCSNVGFRDGTVIWANSQSLDDEFLISRKCAYVKADSMEWSM